MNPFDESPRGRPRDSSSEHTHELEAALRNLRPRAPEFDTDCFSKIQNESDDPCSTVVTVNGTDAVNPMDTSSLQRSWLTVAGAWGCGAFRNDPVLAAETARAALLSPRFAGAFDRVVFAIPDVGKQGKANLAAFREVFGEYR